MNDLYVRGVLCSFRNRIKYIQSLALELFAFQRFHQVIVAHFGVEKHPLRSLHKVGLTKGRWLRALKPFTIYLLPLKILFCVCLAHAGQRGLGNPAAAGVALATDSIKPLQIGDTIPEALWSLPLQMVRAGQEGSTNVTLNDYKGKLIILDFWSTWCGACLQSFPHIDSLQKQYGDKLAILLINPYETEIKIQQRLALIGSQARLPHVDRVSGMDMFKRYFAYSGLPHHVWISEKGVLLASTAGYNLERHTLEEYFNSGKVTLIEKKIRRYQDQRDFDSLQRYAERSTLKCFSEIANYVDTLQAETGTRQLAKGTILYAINQPILALYRFAYGKTKVNNVFRFDNRLILDVVDSSRLVEPKEPHLWDAWREQNSFSYKAYAETASADFLFEKLKNDLDTYFGLKSCLKYRKIVCWVLLKTADEGRLETKGGEPIANADLEGFYQLRNIPFSVLANAVKMGLHNEGEPFLDKTDMVANIDIKISRESLRNPILLKKELGRYGLDLVKREEMIQLLVIKDSN